MWIGVDGGLVWKIKFIVGPPSLDWPGLNGQPMQCVPPNDLKVPTCLSYYFNPEVTAHYWDSSVHGHTPSDYTHL